MAMRGDSERVGHLKTFQRRGSTGTTIPDGANAFRLQAFDRVQDQAPGAGRVRGQVEAAEHAVDEQAHIVEHLLEFREGGRADRCGEFPRPLPVDDYLAGPGSAPEEGERNVLHDYRPVVP